MFQVKIKVITMFTEKERNPMENFIYPDAEMKEQAVKIFKKHAKHDSNTL